MTRRLRKKKSRLVFTDTKTCERCRVRSADSNAWGGTLCEVCAEEIEKDGAKRQGWGIRYRQNRAKARLRKKVALRGVYKGQGRPNPTLYAKWRRSRDVDLMRVPSHLLQKCHESRVGSSGRLTKVVHKPHCTVGHPKCKWRRKQAGQVVCDCPAYGFPHRQGSGLCGQQIYGKWRRPGIAADAERVYTTITSRGRKDRFSTLKRAVEHARILAAHDRVHVDVLLGSRVVSRVRPGVARSASRRRIRFGVDRFVQRDAVPLERRAESRTLDIFTGKTKLDEGVKGRQDWKAQATKLQRELAACKAAVQSGSRDRGRPRKGRRTARDGRKIPVFGWKGYKLADLSFADLNELRERLIADPKNHTPRGPEGRPLKGIWLYTPATRKKLDALAWAVTYKLQGQGGATRHDASRSRSRKKGRR